MARVRANSGRALSKKDTKSLAKEAEKGYDLSRAKRERVKRGRPSLGKGVSPRIGYRVPPGLYARTRKKAESEGRTVSEVAREALERYVS